MTTACPGFASYQILGTGQVEVNGSIPTFAGGKPVDDLVEAWGKYGRSIVSASREHGVPAPWLVGVMMAESKGNQRACSPCSICRAELCETGAGQRCCAFGLMQFIAQTAIIYDTSPTQIMNNPSVAIDRGARLLRDLMDRFGSDLILISASYNAGSPRCSKTGTTFGLQTNGDYPFEVAKYANTFVSLGLPVPLNTAAIGAAAALVGVGFAVAIYMGKI